MSPQAWKPRGQTPGFCGRRPRGTERTAAGALLLGLRPARTHVMALPQFPKHVRGRWAGRGLAGPPGPKRGPRGEPCHSSAKAQPRSTRPRWLSPRSGQADRWIMGHTGGEAGQGRPRLTRLPGTPHSHVKVHPASPASLPPAAPEWGVGVLLGHGQEFGDIDGPLF